MEELDALFFAQAANEQGAFVFSNDEAIAALHYYLLEAFGAHDAVVAVEELHVLPYAGVAVFVLLKVLAQGVPRTKVAPAKVGGNDEDFFCVLKDGVVHADGFARGEGLVDSLLLLRGVEHGQEVFEDFSHGGLINAEGVDNGRNAPNEDARVPQIAGVLDVGFSGFEVGFFLECLHAENRASARRAIGHVAFDVAVAGFGARGLDAEGDDGIGFGTEVEGFADALAEHVGLHNDMVGGCDNDVGFAVDFLDAPAGIGNAGSRVAPARFKDDVALRDAGQLLGYEGSILTGRDNPNVLGRHHVLKAFNSKLYQGLSATKDIKKLLRTFFAAQRPKSATYAAGHNH